MSSSVFIPPSPDALASSQAMILAYGLVSLLGNVPYSEWNTEVSIQSSGTDYETICIRWTQKIELHAGCPVHGVHLDREKTLKLNSRVLVKSLTQLRAQDSLDYVLDAIFQTLEKEKRDYQEGRKT